MPSVQVRDVPDAIHAALDEVLERIENRPKGHLSALDVVDALGEERVRR